MNVLSFDKAFFANATIKCFVYRAVKKRCSGNHPATPYLTNKLNDEPKDKSFYLSNATMLLYFNHD